MGFTVIYSNPELTAKAGFGMVSTLPFLMDNESRYHDLGSEYIIDRGLGYWNPNTAFQGPRRQHPTPKSVHNYATWLANFLLWAKLRGKSLSNMDYWDDVHSGYQAEMQSGLWSVNGRPLMPRTLNQRVDVACDFLRWLSAKGLRSEFVVPTRTRSTRDSSTTFPVSGDSKDIEERQGKVPVEKQDLVMPTVPQVRVWLESVGANWGLARQLACETILLTALRESEVAGLRVDSLPENRCDWHISNPDAPIDKQEVIIPVVYGTKGNFYGWDHGDKVGPSGKIRIPLKLALKWHEYRQKYRHKSLALWVAKATNLKEKRRRIDASVHLFLCERTGKRISQDNIYRAWKNKKQMLPFEQWRPHLGRDWWACMTLQQEVSKLEVIKKLGAHASVQLVKDVSLQIIDLRIRPQLRHTSKQAVETYLVWVSSQFAAPIEIEYDALLRIGEDLK